MQVSIEKFCDNFSSSMRVRWTVCGVECQFFMRSKNVDQMNDSIWNCIGVVNDFMERSDKAQKWRKQIRFRSLSQLQGVKNFNLVTRLLAQLLCTMNSLCEGFHSHQEFYSSMAMQNLPMSQSGSPLIFTPPPYPRNFRQKFYPPVNYIVSSPSHQLLFSIWLIRHDIL